MRVRVTIDDGLLADARAASGIDDLSQLVEAGLRALIQREAGRRLAALGGSAPEFVAPPRRRFPPER
jgi:Arc/MetJ family transcription regulator